MGLVDYPTKKVIASEPVTTVKSFVKDFNVVHGMASYEIICCIHYERSNSM